MLEDRASRAFSRRVLEVRSEKPDPRAAKRPLADPDRVVLRRVPWEQSCARLPLAPGAALRVHVDVRRTKPGAGGRRSSNASLTRVSRCLRIAVNSNELSVQQALA